jgi:hypothetical protein
MNYDVDQHIEFEFSSSSRKIDKYYPQNRRFVLGYISATYEAETEGDIYVSVYFKRDNTLRWESVTFKMNTDDRRMYQKLPAQITVIEYYVKIYGYATEFELTSLEILEDVISIGKFGGEPLLLMDDEITVTPPLPVDYVNFEIHIPNVGNVTANSATVTFATTHPALGRVIYGLSPETMINEVSWEEYESYHSFLLTALQIEEPYYCQMIAVSELTGKEIRTDPIMFFTGKEITLQSIFDNPIAEFEIKVKNELFIENVLSETEILNTLEPDGIGDVSNDAVFTTHTKIELEAYNIIGSDFDYSVTP